MNLNFSILDQNMKWNNFTPIQMELWGMVLYGRKIEEHMYICCFMDAINQWQITCEQLKDTASRIKNKFLSQGCSQVDLLYIVFSRNPGECRELIGEDYKIWPVNVRTRHTMLFEGQPKTFLGMENVVPQFLLEQKNQNKTGKRQKPVVTISLIIINVFMFIFMALQDSALGQEYLLQWGALKSGLVIEQHEYYRLFVSMFLHWSVEYLLADIVILYIFGAMAEQYISKIKYLLFYVMSGVAASVVSVVYFYYVAETKYMLAGALGATYGVWGVIVGTVCASKGKTGGYSPLQAVVTTIFLMVLGMGSAYLVMQVGGFVMGLVLGVINQLLVQRNQGKSLEKD